MYGEASNVNLISLFTVVCVLCLIVWKIFSRNNKNILSKVIIIASGLFFITYQFNEISNNNLGLQKSHDELINAYTNKIELNNKKTDIKIDKFNNKIDLLLNRIDYLNGKLDTHITTSSIDNDVIVASNSFKSRTNPSISKLITMQQPPPPSPSSPSLIEHKSINDEHSSNKKKEKVVNNEDEVYDYKPEPLPLPNQPILSNYSSFNMKTFIINPEDKKKYFMNIPTVGGISGNIAYKWAKNNIPFIDLPDYLDIEKVYYYRWKVYREHLVETQCIHAPIVVTECRFATTPPPLNITDQNRIRLPTDGGEGCHWGDINGVIGAANGHHIIEGRWLRNDGIYMKSYIKYLLNFDVLTGITLTGSCNEDKSLFSTKAIEGKQQKVSKRAQRRIYSEWLIFAIYNNYLINNDIEFIKEIISFLKKDLKSLIMKQRADLCRSKSCYKSIENVPKCYWISDTYDAMEGSVSGAGCRPSIHAIVYGETKSLAFLLNEIKLLSNEYNNNHDQEEEKVTYNKEKAKNVHDDKLKKQEEEVEKYLKDAEEIRLSFIESYWNEKLQFFTTYKTVERCDHEKKSTTPISCEWLGVQYPCDEQVDVRELIGLGPAWMFGLIQPINSNSDPMKSTDDIITTTTKYEVSWHMLLKEEGFKGKYGIRTTERQHHCYNFTGEGRCEWNGPSWPFETSRLLTGLGELLQPLLSLTFHNQPYSISQKITSKMENIIFIELLLQYAKQHMKVHYINKRDPWNYDINPFLISENYHADDGYWIDRNSAYKFSRKRGNGMFNDDGIKRDRNRGIDYLHSTYCDLVLSHLFGIRPLSPSSSSLKMKTSASFIISPLLIGTNISRFAVDRLRLRGFEIGIIYDPKGNYYLKQNINNENTDTDMSYDEKKKSSFLCTGFCVFVNGKLSNSSLLLEPLYIWLPI